MKTVKRSAKLDLVLKWTVGSLIFSLFAVWLVVGQPDWLRFLIVALVALYFLVIRVVLNMHRLKVLNEEPADHAAADTQDAEKTGA